jgi:hypothetical protein
MDPKGLEMVLHEPLLKKATLGTFELVKGAPNVKII